MRRPNASGRAQEERERLAKEEAARQARFAAEQARIEREDEARTKAERDAAARRAQAWHARQAAFALRWRMVAWLAHQGADPLMRQHLEDARIAARRDEQRRQYEARARREVEIAVARRAAFDLRFQAGGTADGGRRDPDFRRKRDEAMFREMDAEAKRTQTARAEAAERVRWETQAALDLRVLAEAATAPAGRARSPDLSATAGRNAAACAVRGRDMDPGSLRLEWPRLGLELGPLRTSARRRQRLGPARADRRQRHAGRAPRPWVRITLGAPNR